ncbi:MAG: exodeoxyribonuclease VII large subunit [Turicibacter sp.]|nr:exodeoxyribonuclease VII large subunit [Turicibacter sp.]
MDEGIASGTKSYTVTQVNNYIKGLLEDDILLGNLHVEGEISNFKGHGSGHLYFTLKDAKAAFNCVMFASFARSLKFEPTNGAKVVVRGNISLYEKTGQYQLYATNIKPLGVGDLAAAFATLHANLQREGLFDSSRKKQIPESFECVALVTSPTGAAIQDMVSVIKKRNPGVKIVIFPTLVQGVTAAADIARAIGEVNEWGKADIIIVGRGGGSMEDLWAFNEEEVARAIFASQIPVVSAVGHETDFTIADFVADLRTPTPTAAATLVPDISSMFLAYEALAKRLDLTMSRRLDDAHTKFMLASQLLESLSPYAIWERGYSLLTKNAKKLQSVAELSAGETIEIYMRDGKVSAKILEIEKNDI